MLVLPTSTESFARREAGGKGFNLYRMSALGLPVPPFAVLGRRFFDRYLASSSLGERLAELLRGVAAARVAPEEAEARVRGWMEETPLGAELQDWVERAYDAVGRGETIAVRSSAADEDSRAFSFAGQLSSFLYVRGLEGAAQAVRRCWASGFSARSLQYRLSNALPLAAIRVSVVLQRMIDADAAGVLFTCDPAAGSLQRFVVSAVFGAGEGLVSGALDADTYWLEAGTGRLLQRQLVHKAVALRAGDSGGCRPAALASGLQDESVLSEAQLQSLWQLGKRLLDDLRTPQDVEWAIKDGALHLLQTRAVTSLPRNLTGYPNLWDNSNIVESYGGVTSPLSFTFALRNYRSVYLQFCEILGVPAPVVRDMESYLGNMLGCLHGRVYYNLYNWYKLVGVLPGFRHNREFMETMMGVREACGSEIEERIRPHESWDTWRGRLRRFEVGLHFCWYHVRIQAMVDRFLAFFDRAHLEFRELDYRRMGSDEIFATYQRMEREMLGQWKAPIVNDFLCMVHFGLLRKLVGSWLGAGDSDIQNDLIAGDGQLESAEPTRVLLRMARTAAADPPLRQILVETPAEDLMESLNQAPEHHAFAGQVRDYVDRFGFRCMNEMKLEEIDLFGDPSFLFTVLKNYLRAPAIPDPDQEQRRERQRRAEAEQRVRAALSGWRRVVFFWVLRHARKAVRNRENTRFARTRAYGVIRAMFHAMGEDLAARRALASPDDIFFLTIDEVAGAHHGTLTAFDLSELAALRRRAYTRFAEEEPDPRLLTRGPVYWGNPMTTEQQPVGPAADEEADLRGLPCGPGVVEGVVKVVRSPRDDLQLAGEILVAPRTDPGWVPLYPSIRGLLVEKGSLLSHSAIVAREMGLPAIVGVSGLMRTLRTGMRVRLDGRRGTVKILPS